MESVSIHDQKVIDNRQVNMDDALCQLLPLGQNFSMAVGYFYLGGYQLIKEEFNNIASKNPIRVIMGNRTDHKTAGVIQDGVEKYEARFIPEESDSTPIDAIRQQIEAIKSESEESHAAYNLRDLIAYGRLKIKVYTGSSDYFHAKVYLIGREVIDDGYAIIGSSNFSRGGFTGNSELNVLTKDSFPNLRKWFDDLWQSDDVEDFSIELLELIESAIKKPTLYTPPFESIIFDSPPDFVIPAWLDIREYQKDAIRSWFQNNGHGILEMATGSGKTITSLIAAAKLYEKLGKVALIIVCPYQHLVVQWEKECRNFNLAPVLGFESRKLWEKELNSKITSYNIEAISHFCLITTNDTFASKTMQDSLAKLRVGTLLIADECHHLGAQDMRDKLPDNMSYRLGLSATPDRWFDDEGSEAIRHYFTNGVIYTYSLADAIGTFLTEYYYYPHIVTLTEDENEEYLDLSQKISKLSAMDGDIESTGNQYLKVLLLKRAKLISKAENKYVVLKELLKDQTSSTHNIFYCGSAKDEGERQVEKLVKILGNDLGMRVHPFTAQENKQQRKELLSKFENGTLQGLVAIKCLDEGVDVPATKTAYILASSTNPREFIQRRGRLLRKAPGKKYAYIHDFIVIPRDLDEIRKIDTSIFNTERKLVKKELTRFKEFADLAENNQQARAIVLQVASKYNLLDF
ncbi:MAG: DNA phosphorothioation system restriction enzyme [Chlorobium sp.]|nr:DNA phosphorothioation system restriction enzyme [Chlorobium sp.]